MKISFTANGREFSLDVDPRETLLDVLRDRLGLTGPKKGCDETVCGACAVLLEGEAVCSCTVLSPEADGMEVVTIEGLSWKGGRDPLQTAFMEKDALQCGFCTSGQIIAARSFLDSGPGDMSDESIREAMSGNLCRCGAYNMIVEAVKKAAREREG